jgi:hypothetical protein
MSQRKNALVTIVLLLQPFRGVLAAPSLRIGRRNASRAMIVSEQGRDGGSFNAQIR